MKQFKVMKFDKTLSENGYWVRNYVEVKSFLPWSDAVALSRSIRGSQVVEIR